MSTACRSAATSTIGDLILSDRVALPAGLQKIADAAGVEAALKIALARGGSRLYVPQRVEGWTEIVELVGLDSARKIVVELQREYFEIPLSKKIICEWLRDLGWSQERRAVALKLSRRTVQYWDNKNTPARQPDLFPSQ